MPLELPFKFLFRPEPVVQSHSLHAAARSINGADALADLFRAGGQLGRLHRWRALMLFRGFMF